jgi:hypothetical protein
MILDCCYSGIATRGDRSIALETLPKEKFNEDMNLSGKGRIVIASGEKDRRSREIQGCVHGENNIPHPHGWFTYHFIEGLDGKAADNNGIVTLNKLYEYIEQNIPSKEQKPTLSVTEGSKINQIHISISVETHNKRKTELLRGASVFDEKRIRSLRDAAFKVKEFLDLDPNNQEGTQLKDRINLILNTHRKNFFQWLTFNESKYYQRIENEISSDLYTKLFGYCMNLQFDPFVTMDEKQFCFIKAISDEYHIPNQSDFVLRCSACFNMPDSEPQDGDNI